MANANKNEPSIAESDTTASSAERFPTDAWLLAMRPRTLAVAIGPIAVGSAVAAVEHGARVLPALAAMLGAILLQLGSNFANDVYDFESGVDNDERIGPPRATQLGLLSPAQMRRGMWSVFSVAGLVGLYLISIAGWPVTVVGILSILAAIGYTGGPWPLGYHGLGDPMVFLFFGILAVCGSAYVQTLELSALALATSVPVGCLATATLVVNNVRDRKTDARAGKRTLAVRLGDRGSRLEYLLLLTIAYAAIPICWSVFDLSRWIFLPFLTLPLAATLTSRVLQSIDGPTLNKTLGSTAQLGMAFSILFAVGLWSSQ